MLRSIAEGNQGADATNGQRLTPAFDPAVWSNVKGRGPGWHAELTQPGHHYLCTTSTHSAISCPNRIRLRRPRRRGPTSDRSPSKGQRARPGASRRRPDRGLSGRKRKCGGRPLGDAPFRDEKPDPYDEMFLLAVNGSRLDARPPGERETPCRGRRRRGPGQLRKPAHIAAESCTAPSSPG